MAKPKLKALPEGSTSDGIIAQFEKLAAMSKEERTKYISEVTKRAAKTKLSEQDYIMEMAADGYFQNEDGDIVV